nr:hypothetical protein [Pseudomonas caspiana]
MVMLTLEEKRVSQRQQKMRWYQRERTTKPKKAQVPDAPEVRASSRERTYSRSSEQRYQPNQEEEEPPELNRQVEKGNGRSRSSGGAVRSDRTSRVRAGREKRECGRSVSATSVGRTTSGTMAKRNDQRKNQQTQKRFRHKCRAYKYRKNDDAKGEKEIKLIKGMGRGGRAAIERNAIA